MKFVRFTCLAAFPVLPTVLALLALSCRGATGDANFNPDSGIPTVTCTSDATCTGGLACVAKQCVPRRANIGNWAIEIAPPGGSGAQLTELPAVQGATSVLRARATIPFTVSFSGGANSGTVVPSNASVVLSVPSQIPGRPALSYQANFPRPGSPSVTLDIADLPADAPHAAKVRLVPLAPADQDSPPYDFPVTVPADSGGSQTLTLPGGPYTLRGVLRDAFNVPKAQFTARAFQPEIGVDQGVLVSTVRSTSATGEFIVVLPAPATNVATTLELIPASGTADPWITFKDLSLKQQNTDLGLITLPGYLMARAYSVTVHGMDQARTPIADAKVRAHTPISGSGGAGGTTVGTGSGGAGGGAVITGTAGTTGAGGTAGAGGATGTGGTTTTGDPYAGGAPVPLTQFSRDGLTGADGAAILPLIPGDTVVARQYTLTVVPPAGSIWASQCLSMVMVRWPQTEPELLIDVSLDRRPVISGSVLSATGAPVANVVVTATATSDPESPCLLGPPKTSTLTDAAGTFTLPLDKGVYQVEYDPPAGSAVPRQTELNKAVISDDTWLVTLPAGALVEGDIFFGAGDERLPNASVRIFEPRCDTVDPCMTPPLLRAQAQADAHGHFRAIVPMTGTAGTN